MELKAIVNTKKIEEQKTEKPKYHYDYTLVVLVLMLVCFGLIMVCSASSYTAVKYDVAATYYLKRQAGFAIAGIALMLIIGRMNYEWTRFRVPVVDKSILIFAYIFACLLQVLVFAIGESTNGSARWLSLPGIGRFQPSEFSKIVIILLVAYAVSRRPKQLDTFIGFIGTIAYVSIIAGLVILENLSTALVIMCIAVAMCFVASRRTIYFGVFALLIVAGGLLAISAEGYRASRINQWLNVETEGYQILQGLYAICSGGWFGKGLGNSVQKLGYIPEVHTDMIFSIVCEELGILGAILLLLVYALLLHRIYKIIINSRDLYGALICTGVFAHIALQVVLNVAVVTNTVPSTGVTLPFISYGGTSLVTMLIEMGLVLSVSSHIEYEE